MHSSSRLLLLMLVLGVAGCGGVRQILSEPYTKTWVDVVPAPPVAAVLPAPHAPPVALPPGILPLRPDAPSAADRAAQAGRPRDAYKEMLRAVWKEFKDNHVPAQVLTIVLNRALHQELAPDLSMPPAPGQVDVSTGGLAALLLALVVGLLKRRFAPSGSSTSQKG